MRGNIVELSCADDVIHELESKLIVTLVLNEYNLPNDSFDSVTTTRIERNTAHVQDNDYDATIHN